MPSGGEEPRSTRGTDPGDGRADTAKTATAPAADGAPFLGDNPAGLRRSGKTETVCGKAEKLRQFGAQEAGKERPT